MSIVQVKSARVNCCRLDKWACVSVLRCTKSPAAVINLAQRGEGRCANAEHKVGGVLVA